MSDANSGGFNINKLFSGGLGKVRVMASVPNSIKRVWFPQVHFTRSLHVYYRVGERQHG